MAARQARTEKPRPIPPWATQNVEDNVPLTIDGEAQAQAQAPTPDVDKSAIPEHKSTWAFGRLHEVECPFHEGLSVLYNIDAKYGILNNSGTAKNDDGKGWLRSIRYIAPFYRGWGERRHPMTEEMMPEPTPDNLDSYLGVTTLFGDWLLKEGWPQALDEFSGTTKNT